MIPNSSDINDPINQCFKLAQQGSIDAQYDLGLMYHEEQNEEEAFKWFKKAAEQGDADAQYKIGLYYDIGQGVKRDRNEANKWLTEAANQGNKDVESWLKIRDSLPLF